MAKKHNTVSRGAEFWQKTVQQFSASGLSQSEFCRQHNFPVNTFRRWFRKAGQSLSTQKAQSEQSEALFVPVRVKVENSAHSAGVIEILLRNDRRIRVASGFNIDEVASLVRRLEEI